MLRPCLKISLIVLSLFSCTVYAQLYKGVDDQGNTVYSDKPFQNAEEINPPPLSVMDAPKQEKKAEEAPETPEAVETSYTSFNIQSPAQKETLWNQPNVTVTMALEPPLAVNEGHSISLLVDGRPVIQKSGSPVIQAGRLDRGTHTLQGRIYNKTGKVIESTSPVTVYIKQTSVIKPVVTPH